MASLGWAPGRLSFLGPSAPDSELRHRAVNSSWLGLPTLPLLHLSLFLILCGRVILTPEAPSACFHRQTDGQHQKSSSQWALRNDGETCLRVTNRNQHKKKGWSTEQLAITYDTFRACAGHWIRIEQGCIFCLYVSQ